MKLKNIAAAVILFSTFTGAAHAARPGFYIGGGLGNSSLQNFSDATVQQSDALGTALFVGYTLNKYLGLELGYHTFGKTQYSVDGYDSLNVNYNLQNVSFVGKLYVPVDENSPVNLYFSLGAANVSTSVSVDNTSSQYYLLKDAPKNILAPTVGMGLTYNFTPHIIGGIDTTFTGGQDGNDTQLGVPQSLLTTLNISYGF